MNGHAKECEKALNIDSPSYRGQKTAKGDETEWVLVDGVCKELAPRYWTSVQAEGKPVREFWKDFHYRAPRALTDVDISATVPWWEQYEDKTSSFLNAPVAPETRIDQTDIDNRTHPLVLASASDRVQDMLERKAHNYRRTLARRNRPLPEPLFLIPQVEDRRIRPTTNVYIRPIAPADIRGITVNL